jgi:hypothetical protein
LKLAGTTAASKKGSVAGASVGPVKNSKAWTLAPQNASQSAIIRPGHSRMAGDEIVQ